MKKYILLIAYLLFATVAICQTKVALTEIDFTETEKGIQELKFIKVYNKTKTINLKDGLIYKFDRSLNSDTAYYYNPGNEEWEVTLTVKKKVTVPVQVDAEAATFVGMWTRNTNQPGWFANSIAYSNSTGAYLTYTFEGKKIELYAEKKSTHGTGVIAISEGGVAYVTVGTVNFNTAPYGLPVLVYSKEWPTSAVRTIRLDQFFGYVLADYFMVTK